MLPLVELPEIVRHYAPWFASVFSPEALTQFQRYITILPCFTHFNSKSRQSLMALQVLVAATRRRRCYGHWQPPSRRPFPRDRRSATSCHPCWRPSAHREPRAASQGYRQA
jgi:hypothetical protein